jgi:hypothetical protein
MLTVPIEIDECANERNVKHSLCRHERLCRTVGSVLREFACSD